MPVIHIKDKEVVGHEIRMAPIGEGNMDWQNLLPSDGHVKWYRGSAVSPGEIATNSTFAQSIDATY